MSSVWDTQCFGTSYKNFLNVTVQRYPWISTGKTVEVAVHVRTTWLADIFVIDKFDGGSGTVNIDYG